VLLKVQGLGVRKIAECLGRSPSTISRELRRDAATRGGRLEYRATVAQWAELAARSPTTSKPAGNDRLRHTCKIAWPARSNTQTRPRLRARMSAGSVAATVDARTGAGRRHGAQQIANRLPLDFPDDESMRISHEAIYQALFDRGAARRRGVGTVSAHRPRASSAPRQNPQQGQEVRHARGHDQRTPGRGQRPDRARALGISMLLSSGWSKQRLGRFLVGGAVAEHRPYRVDASSGEGDEGLLVGLAFGAFAFVERPCRWAALELESAAR
jgi:IS30 family transposase